METIEELRKKRNNLSVKISTAKRKGKDTSTLEAEMAKLRDVIKNFGKTVVEENEGKDLGTKPERVVDVYPKTKEPKAWTPKELDKCKKYLDSVLDSNDWSNGYQFRSSDYMFLRNPSTRVIADAVELTHDVEYRTKNHRVVKTVRKYFNPDTQDMLQRYIDGVELWVMRNSGDLDDKNIVFGQRFNKVQFEAQGFVEAGWIIKR